MAQAKLLNTHNSVRNKSKPTTKPSSQPLKAIPSSTQASTSTSTSTSASGSTKRVPSAPKAAQPQRTVYKPVLANPFQIEWPPLPPSLRNRLLDLLIEALQPSTSAEPAEEGQQEGLSISEWRELQHKNKRDLGSKTRRQNQNQRNKSSGNEQDQGQHIGKRKRKEEDRGDGQHPISEGKAPKSKKARVKVPSKESEAAAASTSLLANATNDPPPPPPPQPSTATPAPDSTHTLTLRSSKILTVPNFVDKPPGSSTNPSPKVVTLPPKPKMLDSLVVGINDLTRALESQIRWTKWELGDRDAAPRMRFEKAKQVQAVLSDKLDKAKNKEERTSKTRRKHRSLEASDDHARWDEIVLGPHMTPDQNELVDEPYRFLLDPSKTDSLDLEEASYIRRFDALDKMGSGSTFPKILNNSLAFRIKSPRTRVSSPTPGEIRSKTKNKSSSTHKPPPRNTEPSEPYYPLIDLVFVCKPDINPASLVGHLPTMCAATNGLQKAVSVERKRRQEAMKETVKARDRVGREEDGMEVEEEQVAQAEVEEPDRFVYLIPLDVGAEHRLAEVMGLRRVAAIGVCSSSSSTFAPLLSLVREHLQPLFVPWLNPSPKAVSARATTTTITTFPPKAEPRFVPTHIKHLKTTQPLNPRAAHTLKKEGKKKTREARRDLLTKKKKEKKGKGEEVYVVDEEMNY